MDDVGKQILENTKRMRFVVKGVMYIYMKYIGYMCALCFMLTLKKTLLLPSSVKSICFTFMGSDAIYSSDL